MQEQPQQFKPNTVTVNCLMTTALWSGVFLLLFQQLNHEQRFSHNLADRRVREYDLVEVLDRKL